MKQMVEKFPELRNIREVTSHQNETSLVKYALDSSMSKERRMSYFGFENEIKRETPEECVQSINMLSKAIGNAHRDILFYSYLQGELLSNLKEVHGSAFSSILRNNIDISRSHAFFLMKFYKLVSDYPRLLRCQLPLNYFQKNFSTIKVIYDGEEIIWKDAN